MDRRRGRYDESAYGRDAAAAADDGPGFPEDRDQDEAFNEVRNAPSKNVNAELLNFTCRQAALRAVERWRHDHLRPSDRLFIIFTLYYAERTTPFSEIILLSPVRLPFEHPVKLLQSPSLTRGETNDLRDTLREFVEAAASSAGPTAARFTADSHLSFWAKCARFLDAVNTERDWHDAAYAEARATGTRPSECAKHANEEVEDLVLSLISKAEELPTLAAELKALARVDDNAGIDRKFYGAAALLADVLVARRLLEQYDTSYHNEEEVPDPPEARGTAPDAEMTEGDAEGVMVAAGESLGVNQQLHMDEQAKYGTQQLPAWARLPGADPRKPDRFAKVITKAFNTQYNKTHYNMRSNPAPKTVQGYEFTLFYPDLQSDRVPTYRKQLLEKGLEDEHCLLIFHAGPPYLDVAYRIVNMRWDKKRQRATFDQATGRFNLYFRFTYTSYRR